MKKDLSQHLNHISVLKKEAINGLFIQGSRCNGIFVDGTYGRGGHSKEILNKLSENGRLIALDKDPEVIKNVEEIIYKDSRFKIFHSSFNKIDEILMENKINKIDGLLLDLGISSTQLEDSKRGFSFKKNGPLDMRMDTSKGITLEKWLATEKEFKIARVIREYGEEKFSKKIAKEIVYQRSLCPITSTRQLSSIIKKVVKTREEGKDPATRTFQAFRIYINRELDDLKDCLDQAFLKLAPYGRLVVISFHSLEDRIVKNFIRSKEKFFFPEYKLPILDKDLPSSKMRLISRIKPNLSEVESNPRSRSAIMRIAERIP
tara:strand:+ start:43 stop:996 length:954 start_codon:yes stop_codon:yes gene_type:complete